MTPKILCPSIDKIIYFLEGLCVENKANSLAVKTYRTCLFHLKQARVFVERCSDFSDIEVCSHYFPTSVNRLVEAQYAIVQKANKSMFGLTMEEKSVLLSLNKILRLLRTFATRKTIEDLV